jgi:hypothetical protein
VVPWVLGTAMTHRRSYWNERRVLAPGARGPGRARWRAYALAARPGLPAPPRSGEPQLLPGLQAAGATEDAETRPAELLGDLHKPAGEKMRPRRHSRGSSPQDPALGALFQGVQRR